MKVALLSMNKHNINTQWWALLTQEQYQIWTQMGNIMFKNIPRMWGKLLIFSRVDHSIKVSAWGWGLAGQNVYRKAMNHSPCQLLGCLPCDTHIIRRRCPPFLFQLKNKKWKKPTIKFEQWKRHRHYDEPHIQINAYMFNVLLQLESIEIACH